MQVGALILDGEVCAFDANLVSHIYLLDAKPEEPATPPVFMAFDCLCQRGRDLRARPLAYRRQGARGFGHGCGAHLLRTGGCAHTARTPGSR